MNLCIAFRSTLPLQARERAERSKVKPLQVAPLHGTLPKEQQLKAFFTPAKGNRKVVVATNLAEASASRLAIGA